MRELELKFWLPLALQDSLARDDAPGTGSAERVWSCYYDTVDGALARARMAVRVRRHGERWLQTVKAETGDRFERFEWERPIAGPAPERAALPPEDTPQGALAHRSFAQWRPLFETDFERHATRVQAAAGLVVEIARDVGELRCGERREPIREVELECLEGSRAAFFDWALDWATRSQACLLMPTKNERGLRLAARLPLAPAPVKAIATAPAADVPTGEAAAAVIGACVAHACANVEPILASDHPEGPHQLRVALRRLRAALRLFDLRERDASWRAVDDEASVLADAAGRVRDLDVLEDGLLRTLRGAFADDAAIESLSRALVDARETARMALRRTLVAPHTTGFVLRTLAAAESLRGAPLEPPDFGAFTAARLEALHRRVRRRARRATDADGWHRTRLAVKTLRYAVEFSAAALPRGVDPAGVQALLARWQERLGEGQDIAAARDVAADALAGPDVPVEAAVRALALIDGWRAFAAPAASDPQRRARRTLGALRAALRPVAAAKDASARAQAPAPEPVAAGDAPAEAGRSGDAVAGDHDDASQDAAAGPLPSTPVASSAPNGSSAPTGTPPDPARTA